MWAWPLLPAHFRFNWQRETGWKTKRDVYERFNSSVLVVTALFPPSIHILVGDSEVSFAPRTQQRFVAHRPAVLPQAFKVVSNDRGHFEKMDAGSPLGDVFGPNILNTNRNEWRRHRRVTAPAFSDVSTFVLHAQSSY